MKTLLRVALLAAGIGILVWLLRSFQFGEIVAGVVGVGWGIAVIVVYRFANIHLDALGWNCLIARDIRPGTGAIFLFRWIGEAVNQLLPTAQVGGEIVRARLLAQRGAPGVEAAATVVADFSVGLGTQFLFTVVGAALLLAATAGDGNAIWLASTLAALGGIVVVVFAFQRLKGFSKLAAVIRSLAFGSGMDDLTDRIERFDRAVLDLYGRTGDLVRCAGWRLASWFAHAVEVWLIFWFLGNPVSWSDALILESLGAAVRSVAFAIPGAVGIQEGGLLAIGLALGIGAEDALAMALVKRAREILVAGPGLLAWWVVEGRRFWTPKPDAREDRP